MRGTDRHLDARAYEIKTYPDYLRIMSKFMSIGQLCETYGIKRSTAYNVFADLDQSKVLRLYLSPEIARKVSKARPYLVAHRDTVRDHMAQRRRPGNWQFHDSTYQSMYRNSHR